MNFLFEPQSLPEVILIKPEKRGDERGFFMETYRQSIYRKHGIKDVFVQDNAARSRKDVLRGLHYQKFPNPQAKLVSVVKGSILDVAVDIRKGSPNYGQWLSAILSEENRHQLYIPIGFAHGYLALSDNVELSYKVSAEYVPELDRGFLWNDPNIAIDWQIKRPILSQKDQSQPLLKDSDNNFTYGEPV